ncbi:MAG: hypothetical protein RLZZ522_1647 [Verrucomicrobiota bacterium]
MKLRLSFLIFATLALPCGAEDPDPTTAALPMPPSTALPTPPPPGIPPGLRAAVPVAPDAWLGLGVEKLSPSHVEKIPALPPGIGFLVESVLPGGPAEAAQLQPKDVVWKFGDQWLANKAQLATLLNLKRPGDEVTLAVFRSGLPLEVTVKLGTAPPNRKPLARSTYGDDPFRDDRVIFPGERTAIYSTEQGKAVIKREGEGHHVTITDPDEKVTFDRVLPPDGDLDDVPKGWQRRVWVLRRSLDHAIANQIVPIRPPRPRVVPSAPAVPAPPTTASGQ